MTWWKCTTQDVACIAPPASVATCNADVVDAVDLHQRRDVLARCAGTLVGDVLTLLQRTVS